MLFSILEGELEARDLVIEALKVQESYSHNRNSEMISAQICPFNIEQLPAWLYLRTMSC